LEGRIVGPRSKGTSAGGYRAFSKELQVWNTLREKSFPKEIYLI
jgi:hypothetical protein